MSQQYYDYLQEHKFNVKRAYEWMVNMIPEIFISLDKDIDIEHQIIFEHDASKTSQQEFDAYDKYFYGNRSYGVVDNFNRAWLHHIHNNPHHWQHWLLVNDDQGETVTLEIPDNFIIEMICDWWSFSWKSGNLYELFNWYDTQRPNMNINPYTKLKVEAILDVIKRRLDNEK